MKIYKQDKLVTGAKVVYGDDKKPQYVIHDGVRHLASAFKIEEDKPKTKTKKKKVAPKTVNKSAK